MLSLWDPVVLVGAIWQDRYESTGIDDSIQLPGIAARSFASHSVVALQIPPPFG